MGSTFKRTLVTGIAAVSLAVAMLPLGTRLAADQTSGSGAPQRLDLVALLAAGKLRAVNRSVTKLDGARSGIHVSERPELGLVWIDGTDFSEGTIEMDVRGRDVQQQSFLGIAFHRRDDSTYETVFLRPFNFRTTDPVRLQHAIQYMAVPTYGWQRLRQEFPEEFENPVGSSVLPTDWVALRVVVAASRVQVFVGPGPTPALEVRKLGEDNRGMIGLWTGTVSDGDFANLRVTPAK